MHLDQEHEYRTYIAGPTQNNSKNMCRNFREIFFCKKKFYTKNKRISGNICRNGICRTLFLEFLKIFGTEVPNLLPRYGIHQ
jgi:hypothetical protein